VRKMEELQDYKHGLLITLATNLDAEVCPPFFKLVFSVFMLCRDLLFFVLHLTFDPCTSHHRKAKL
jgi:hypothetical protein